MTSRTVATPTPLETMSLVNDYLVVFEVYKLLLDIDVLSVNVTGDPHQTKKMAALPWPVDSVTETAAREFFDNAPDPLFPGSWRIENSYSPRICDVKANGKVFAVRFKMYPRAHALQCQRGSSTCTAALNDVEQDQES